MECENYLSFYDNNINYALNKKRIALNLNDRQYEVIINTQNQIIIPDSVIIYNYYYEYNGSRKKFKRTCDMILDPTNMTIGGFDENIFTKKWKERTGHHQRAYGEEHGCLLIKLSNSWKFEKPITKDIFSGNGIEYIIIKSINQQTLSIEFAPLESGKGKQWEVGPFWININNKIKVNLSY